MVLGIRFWLCLVILRFLQPSAQALEDSERSVQQPHSEFWSQPSDFSSIGIVMVTGSTPQPQLSNACEPWR